MDTTKDTPKTILDASALMMYANTAKRSLPKLNGNWTRQIHHFSKKLGKKQNYVAEKLIRELESGLWGLYNELPKAIDFVIKNWGNAYTKDIPTIQNNALALEQIWTKFKTNASGIINILSQVEEKGLKRLAQVVSRDINDIAHLIGTFIERYCDSIKEYSSNTTSATTAPTNVDSGEWYIVEDNFSTAQSENKMQKLADDFANKLDELIK